MKKLMSRLASSDSWSWDIGLEGEWKMERKKESVCMKTEHLIVPTTDAHFSRRVSHFTNDLHWLMMSCTF